jgi:hypothetical protein
MKADLPDFPGSLMTGGKHCRSGHGKPAQLPVSGPGAVANRSHKSAQRLTRQAPQNNFNGPGWGVGPAVVRSAAAER